MRSAQVTVAVDLARVRANAESIAARVTVPVFAVVKADAYGLGVRRVADAIASTVERFVVFGPQDAEALGRPALSLGPVLADGATYERLGLRPAVGTLEEARAVAGLEVAVNLDTGMRRFGCAPDALDALVEATGGRVVEVFTHAVTVEAARALDAAARHLGVLLHAAGSALLDEREAWLDGVRPGFVLYDGAVRVTTRLIAARDADGPVGYGRVPARRVGVIPVGYAHGFAMGAPVVVGGRRQPVLEVGMNTSFVEIAADVGLGAPVELLGPALGARELAAIQATSPHAILCRYCGLGPRVYV